MRYSLGIDFGTSTTKVALRRGDDVPRPLPIGSRGEYFMPSVVAYKRKGNDTAERVAVGEDAAGVPETDDTCVVQEVKRFLVAGKLPPDLPQERYPWWNNDAKCVQLWKSRFSPHDVVLIILNEALERAVGRARDLGFGTDVDRFTIRGLPIRLGCSVIADLQTRKVLSEVARRLGFPQFRVKDIFEEPILASLSYVHLEEIIPGQIILIYDLGGGTFDTAVVEVGKEGATGAPIITVFSQAAEALCGGADIDEALFEHLALRLAEERFGFKGEERLRIVELMNPNEKQMLRSQARAAKETLSSAGATTIALAPGFLNGADLVLDVKRDELESIVKALGLLDRTANCVLRAWRQARMWFRTEGEAAGGWYTRYDRSSGRVSNYVLGLGHSDIKERVQKILVVGGATRMPLVREHLASVWGQHKLISENVVQPVEATSIGAAWQQDVIGKIVDRLPFSIAVSSDAGEQELYRAFEPIVRFRGTTTLSSSIDPFMSDPLLVPAGCKDATVVLRNADGEIMQKCQLSDISQAGCYLEIDMFGRCVIKTGSDVVKEISHPFRHPIQIKLCKRMEEERQQGKVKEQTRARKMLYRSPFLEND